MQIVNYRTDRHWRALYIRRRHPRKGLGSTPGSRCAAALIERDSTFTSGATAFRGRENNLHAHLYVRKELSKQTAGDIELVARCLFNRPDTTNNMILDSRAVN